MGRRDGAPRYGATPRILPNAQPDGQRILTWRQLHDLDELPTDLVVVGSGVTGAEFVSAFTDLRVPVTLVSSRDRVLPGEDTDAATVLEEAQDGVGCRPHQSGDRHGGDRSAGHRRGCGRRPRFRRVSVVSGSITEAGRQLMRHDDLD